MIGAKVKYFIDIEYIKMKNGSDYDKKHSYITKN